MKGILLITALTFAAGTAAAQERGGPLARADADNDGVITRAEFMEARLAPLRRLDADGDGRPDVEEGGADADGDGIPDFLDGPAVKVPRESPPDPSP